MASIRYWVWLSSVSMASPKARAALIEHYGDPERADKNQCIILPEQFSVKCLRILLP